MQNAPLVFSRVLLLIPPTGAFCREDRCQSYFHFELIPTARAPLEECEIAGVIASHGGVASIVDAPIERLSIENVFSRVKAFSPDLIVLVTTFGSLNDDLQFATSLAEQFPSLPIGMRGTPCFMMAEEILRECPAVRFCVRGEYETGFSHIVQFGFKGAPGTAYRRGNEIEVNPAASLISDLDSLPYPDRTSLNQSLYTVRGFRASQATIHVQRGCPFPCTYCLVHTVSGAKARHRSPRHIVQEMKTLIDQGTTYFYLRAETFSVNKRWAIQLSRMIESECPDARWVTTTRVECVDEEVLSAMRAGGCYGVSFGVDVASEELGRKVHKLPQQEAACRAMRLCDQYKILSLAYIMIGFLWETRETLQEAAHFVRAIRPDLLTIHFAHPYPGTKYYEQFSKDTLTISSKKAQSTPAHSCRGISARELEEFASWMRQMHYRRGRVLWSLARKIVPHLGLRFFDVLRLTNTPRPKLCKA